MLDWLETTDHARMRMAQRSLTDQDVDYVCQYGERYQCAGAIHCFLGWRNIPSEDRTDANIQRLEGTTVLIDTKTEIVLTVYRNRRATRQIRRKAKENYRKQVYIQ
jgi:hypothetical protein